MRFYAPTPSPLDGIGFPLTIILSYAQSMMHLLIAVNRFTAFFLPMAHSSIWSRRVVVGTTVTLLFASVLLHAAPCYTVPLQDVLDWVFLLGKSGFIFDNFGLVVFNAYSKLKNKFWWPDELKQEPKLRRNWNSA